MSEGSVRVCCGVSQVCSLCLVADTDMAAGVPREDEDFLLSTAYNDRSPYPS
jgi:hypothetical protein